MAPSTQEIPSATAAAQQNSNTNTANLETAQPVGRQSMTLETPSAPAQQQQEQEEETLRLRGGEMCPGRFCFIIPCPLPCNCCII
ncbi:hypothetical protein PVAG01_04761 [Phlyctema vagabunda]|uniref:Uncharacterized protein n=1 Tax=Phlyctema vagabunda TaxID=108571 RepID=A0ABR4PI98_9HELO